MGLVKDIVGDMVEAVEDMATALLGAILAIFAAGAWYGAAFAGRPALWYPLYLLIILLVLKLAHDVLTRIASGKSGDEKEKKEKKK